MIKPIEPRKPVEPVPTQDIHYPEYIVDTDVPSNETNLSQLYENLINKIKQISGVGFTPGIQIFSYEDFIKNCYFISTQDNDYGDSCYCSCKVLYKTSANLCRSDSDYKKLLNRYKKDCKIYTDKLNESRRLLPK